MFKKTDNLKPSKLKSKLKVNRSNISRIESALHDLGQLNIEKQNDSISKTEYYLRKSKIIKKLYSSDL